MSFLKIIKSFFWQIIPYGSSYLFFQGSITNHVSFKSYLLFKLFSNKDCYWPIHNNSEVTHPRNIHVGICSNPATRPGCYLQGNGKIYIGNYVHFASNIGVISANHDLYNQNEHKVGEVIISDYCWIGMGAIILPNVVLGPRTIVAAGSIVTKSFEEGFCVIGGNPAKIISYIDRSRFIPTFFENKCYGYMSVSEFEKYTKKYNRKIQFKYNLKNTHL